MISFAVQKLVSLIRFYFFIFPFTSIVFRDWPKKTLVQFISDNVLSMFSSSFMMSCLTFKSLNHFGFIFVYGARMCSSSNFINLYAAVQLSQHHLLKRLFHFSIVYSCLLCWELIDHSIWVYLWAVCSVPFIHVSVFVPISAVLITVTLQYCLKSGRVMPLALFLFLRITLAILGLLWFHINFRTICSSPVKNMSNLVRITLNL